MCYFFCMREHATTTEDEMAEITRTEMRTAMNEIIRRILSTTNSKDIPWEHHDHRDEREETPESAMEIIATNGVGITIRLNVSGE